MRCGLCGLEGHIRTYCPKLPAEFLMHSPDDPIANDGWRPLVAADDDTALEALHASSGQPSSSSTCAQPNRRSPRSTPRKSRRDVTRVVMSAEGTMDFSSVTLPADEANPLPPLPSFPDASQGDHDMGRAVGDAAAIAVPDSQDSAFSFGVAIVSDVPATLMDSALAIEGAEGTQNSDGSQLAADGGPAKAARNKH